MIAAIRDMPSVGVGVRRRPTLLWVAGSSADQTFIPPIPSLLHPAPCISHVPSLLVAFHTVYMHGWITDMSSPVRSVVGTIHHTRISKYSKNALSAHLTAS